MDYLVAVNIVMTHVFFRLPYLSNPNNRDKPLKDDPEYVEGIKNSVLYQLRVKSIYHSTDIVSWFSFTPILYSIFGLIQFISDYLNDDVSISPSVKQSPTYQFKYDTFKEILNTSVSLARLINNCQYSSAYDLLRKLVELYFTYVLIKDNKDATDAYKNIGEIRIKYYSDPTFRANYDADPNIPKKQKSKNYLDYGWTSEVLDSNGKPVAHNFGAVKDAVSTNDMPNKVKWNEVYGYCCDFVHTNYCPWSPSNYHFAKISLWFGELFLDLVEEFKKAFIVTSVFYDIDETNQTIDLVDHLKDVVDELTKIQSKIDF